MVRCPNCGRKTDGDECQWCHYPILKGGPMRRQEVQKWEGMEAERQAKGQAKREAEEARRAKLAEDRVK